MFEAVDQLAGDGLDPRILGIAAVVAPVDSAAVISRKVRHQAGLDTADSSGLQLLAFAAYAVGDISQSIELLDRAAPLLRAQGRVGLLAQLLVVRAWASINVGQFSEALREAEEANRLAIETAQPIWTAMSQIARGILLGLRDDEHLAERLITTAGEPLMAPRLSLIHAQTVLARGIVAMTAGTCPGRRQPRGRIGRLAGYGTRLRPSSGPERPPKDSARDTDVRRPPGLEPGKDQGQRSTQNLRPWRAVKRSDGDPGRERCCPGSTARLTFLYHQNTTRPFATNGYLSIRVGTKLLEAEYETALVSTH